MSLVLGSPEPPGKSECSLGALRGEPFTSLRLLVSPSFTVLSAPVSPCPANVCLLYQLAYKLVMVPKVASEEGRVCVLQIKKSPPLNIASA